MGVGLVAVFIEPEDEKKSGRLIGQYNGGPKERRIIYGQVGVLVAVFI